MSPVGCSPNPCLNGALCVTIPGGYSCSCTSGFTGNNCEQQLGKFLDKMIQINLNVVSGGMAEFEQIYPDLNPSLIHW